MPPPGIPEWVYPGTRVRMRSSSMNRPSIWRIESVRMGTNETDLHVCLTPQDGVEAPPGWFPVDWVVANCPPVDNRDARHVSVDAIRNAVETHNLVATANGNGWVSLRALGSEIVRVGHIQVFPSHDAAVYCPEFQGQMVGEIEPVPVIVAFDGGPAQRFNLIGMSLDDRLRVTLEQEPSDNPHVLTVGARVTFGRTSESIRWATVTEIDQLRQVATIQYDDDEMPEEVIPIPRLIAGMSAAPDESEEEEGGPFIIPDWLHEGRVCVDHVNPDHEHFIIEELFQLGEGIEPLVRVRTREDDETHIYLAGELLAFAVPTDQVVPADDLTVLADAANTMMRELPVAFQRLTETTTDILREMADTLRDALGPDPRVQGGPLPWAPPTPSSEPEGPRRSIWERLKDDDAFGD